MTMQTKSKTADSFVDEVAIRQEFPILDSMVNGNGLVYLDNAATTQKPTRVLNALTEFYKRDCSNVHRGLYALSVRATEAYEAAREKIRLFVGAGSANEIIFTRGATEGINLVAATYGRTVVQEGDEILLTELEHHSNIVPWQILCKEKGAMLRVAPVSDSGETSIKDFGRLLSKRTRIAAFAHVSNALGTINPIRELTCMAHDAGAVVLVDGAQSAGHAQIDLSDFDADFFVISSHKMYGPFGVGALYGKESLLRLMPPYQSGGDMIRSVSFEETEYGEPPHKFEAGTPNVAGAIAMGAAVDFLNSLGMQNIHRHEAELLRLAREALAKLPFVTIIGAAPQSAAIVSFVVDGIHPHDVATVLDVEGIAVRAGHHCAQPLMRRFGVPATVRVSFGVYNTPADIERLVEALYKLKEVFH